jgi:hypothetical protein
MEFLELLVLQEQAVLLARQVQAAQLGLQELAVHQVQAVQMVQVEHPVLQVLPVQAEQAE